MTTDLWAYGEIEVDVSGFFATDHTFRTPSGTLASLKASSGLGEAQYQVTGAGSGLIRRSGCLSMSYELKHEGAARGAAEPRGFFRQGYLVRFDSQELQLVPEGFFGQAWLLLDPAGSPLLRIGPRGFLDRGARLVAESPVELPLALLAYYLYAVTRQQSS